VAGSPRIRDNPKIIAALEQTGLPWEIKPGKRHRKVLVAGRVVTILPNYSSGGEAGRHEQNAIAAIRRGARGLTDE